jgi:aryl-alcohol dehydrogenase-like predicted oxidoreductase
VAVAFALLEPSVASVLFGATRPAQVADNAAALELVARLTPADAAELRALGS